MPSFMRQHGRAVETSDQLIGQTFDGILLTNYMNRWNITDAQV